LPPGNEVGYIGYSLWSQIYFTNYWIGTVFWL
jgi:hypothetical protein